MEYTILVKKKANIKKNSNFINEYLQFFRNIITDEIINIAKQVVQYEYE